MIVSYRKIVRFHGSTDSTWRLSQSTPDWHFPPSEAFAERPCGSLPLPREDRRRLVMPNRRNEIAICFSSALEGREA
jgi:hypothetical protein